LFQLRNNTVERQLSLVFPGANIDLDDCGCRSLPDDVKGKVVLYKISCRAKMRPLSASSYP
jgi:hypothetical protein